MTQATLTAAASGLPSELPQNPEIGVVRGGPRLLLQLEGLAMLAGGAAAYALSGASWWAFALLFLLPDASLLAYLAGPRWGAAAYNAAHTTLGPVVLAGAGWALGAPLTFGLAAIWLCHIGLDRAVGYGLKYADRFTHTHLR